MPAPGKSAASIAPAPAAASAHSNSSVEKVAAGTGGMVKCAPGPLLLSQHLELAYALRLVEERPKGVGYLLKERVGRVQQLLDALERVVAGECVVDRAVVDALLDRRRRVDPLEELTPREREILALMAEGRSNQGICRVLWLSPKTVETHIRSAFGKLGIGAAPEDNRRVLAVLAYLRR
jgi:DNA-binding NarL/FixJ family response regulator